MLLAACGTDLNHSQETKQLKITPTNVSVEKMMKDTKIIKIHYKIENKTDKEFVVAANDFIIKSNGDYYYMGSGNNYSDAIKKKSKSEGDGYYEVPKETKEFQLKYLPLDNKERAEWDLKISK